jgi:hypothetical protein
VSNSKPATWHQNRPVPGVDEVITGPVLSRLYGSEIDVVRLTGRIYIRSGGHDVERDVHRHNNQLPQLKSVSPIIG